jgi:predicted translin family RNA/ssDNA-binding protein
MIFSKPAAGTSPRTLEDLLNAHHQQGETIKQLTREIVMLRSALADMKKRFDNADEIAAMAEQQDEDFEVDISDLKRRLDDHERYMMTGVSK